MRGQTHSRYPFLSSLPLRSIAATLAYLVGFGVLLAYVSRHYLLPAMAAAQHANRAERRMLAAHSWLILAIVLFVLFMGLILAFRVGRFFLPRAGTPRSKTQYQDLWAESARRMQTPPAESTDE